MFGTITTPTYTPRTSAPNAAPGPDAIYLETGSQAHTDDIIKAQDRARALDRTETMKRWAPWVLGAVIVGGVLYLRSRND